MEERLGARLTVWIASVALALSGVFLVKYTFDRGLLGPGTRVVLGLIFGVAMLAFGEWFRRKDRRIAAGVTAAAIADLYASLLAGVSLYHLIPAPVGFGLLALVTATAVALSLRQGPIIALVGLVGGFLTPGLIGAEEPSPWTLFAYLFVLQLGLMLVIRRRSWWPLAPLTVVGALGWTAVWLASDYRPEHAFVLGPFVIATVALSVFGRETADGGAARDPGLAGRARAGRLALDLLSSLLGVGGGIAIAGSMAWIGRLGTFEWITFGLLGAGCLWLARRDGVYMPFAWMAPALAAALLWAWGMDLPGSGEPFANQERLRFQITLALLGVLFAGGAYIQMWGSRRPALWASLSGSASTVFLLVGYRFLEDLESPWWGAIALALAGVYCAAALPVARRRASDPGLESALAALAVTVTGFVSLAVPMELERAWISVAWAFEVALLAWIYSRLRVVALAYVAGLVAGAVAVRLLANPFVLFYPIGEHVLWNWLTYGYGLPLAAFALAALVFARQGQERLARALEAGAVAFGFALLTLLLRHYFHAELVDNLRLSAREIGGYTAAWLIYGGLLLLRAERSPFDTRVLTWSSRLSTGASLASALLGTGLVYNPLFRPESVGATPLLNHLLWIYGLPALLATLLAREWQRRARPIEALACGVSALFMWFALVTLELRQAFQGSILHGGATSDAEWYAYSAAWLVFGTLLLVAGIAVRIAILRYASLLVMLLTVFKVFLFDTANLEDLYRVFSYFGLGVSLLLLAYLYQRFVVPRADG